MYRRRNNTQNNTKTQNTRNIKQTYKVYYKTSVEYLENSKEKRIIMTQRTVQNLHTAT